MSDEQIGNLIELATHAPFAFNLQNWKFVAVRCDDAKARLLLLADALRPTLDAGIIDEGLYKGWIGAAQNVYRDNYVFQRDAATRSGSLATMTLILAAEGLGLASGPMIGFDPQGVATAFGLAQSDVPVMPVTVGYAASGNWPQKPRKPVSDVLSFA
ncbi:nitroreductase family protein [Burkholderia sp. AW33-5]